MIKTALTLLLAIYGSGAALSALVFLLIHFRLAGEHARLHRDMMRLAPSYILFWFWRWVGFPAYVCVRIGPRLFFAELREALDG